MYKIKVNKEADIPAKKRFVLLYVFFLVTVMKMIHCCACGKLSTTTNDISSKILQMRNFLIRAG